MCDSTVLHQVYESGRNIASFYNTEVIPCFNLFILYSFHLISSTVPHPHTYQSIAIHTQSFTIVIHPTIYIRSSTFHPFPTSSPHSLPHHHLTGHTLPHPPPSAPHPFILSTTATHSPSLFLLLPLLLSPFPLSFPSPYVSLLFFHTHFFLPSSRSHLNPCSLLSFPLFLLLPLISSLPSSSPK